MIRRWWHVHVLHHTMRVNRHITVPMWDATAKGILYECSCGELWAL